VRLGQVDADQVARRAGPPDVRTDRVRGHRDLRAAGTAASLPAAPAPGGVPGPDGFAGSTDAGTRHHRRTARSAARASATGIHPRVAGCRRPATGCRRPLPAPVLGGPATADLGRSRAVHQAVRAGGGRAGERAGRIGAGADTQPARRPGRRILADGGLRLPRPGRRPARLRHDRGHAPRPDRRTGHRRAGLRAARAPVHPPAGRRRADVAARAGRGGRRRVGPRRGRGGRGPDRYRGGRAVVRFPVDEQAVVEFTRGLVRIRSVHAPQHGRGEAEVAAPVADRMRSFGWSPEVIEVAPGRPNVVAVVEGGGGEGPTLAFEGHTDVVTEGDAADWTVDPYGGEIRDGRLYGRGSADMKSGVAAMIYAVRALEQAGPFPGRVTLCVLADEEGLMLGAKHFAASPAAAAVDAAIIGEPEEGEICIAAKGAIRLQIELTGAMAHGAMPQHGRNPVASTGTLLG